MRKQMRAAARYARATAKGTDRLAAARRRLASSLVDAAVLISPQQIAASRQQVKTSGLPVSAVTALRQAGFTATAIKQFVKNIVASKTPTRSISFPGVLLDRDAARAEAKAADSLRAFADQIRATR